MEDVGHKVGLDGHHHQIASLHQLNVTVGGGDPLLLLTIKTTSKLFFCFIDMYWSIPMYN